MSTVSQTSNEPRRAESRQWALEFEWEQATRAEQSIEKQIEKLLEQKTKARLTSDSRLLNYVLAKVDVDDQWEEIFAKNKQFLELVRNLPENSDGEGTTTIADLDAIVKLLDPRFSVNERAAKADLLGDTPENYNEWYFPTFELHIEDNQDLLKFSLMRAISLLLFVTHVNHFNRSLPGVFTVELEVFTKGISQATIYSGSRNGSQASLFPKDKWTRDNYMNVVSVIRAIAEKRGRHMDTTVYP